MAAAVVALGAAVEAMPATLVEDAAAVVVLEQMLVGVHAVAAAGTGCGDQAVLPSTVAVHMAGRRQGAVAVPEALHAVVTAAAGTRGPANVTAGKPAPRCCSSYIPPPF